MSRYANEFATRADYIAKYRFEYAFYTIHGLLALQPLKRLRHVSHVFIAGIQESKLAQQLNFTPTKTVEEAINEAQSVHGRGAVVACVQYPMMINRQ